MSKKTFGDMIIEISIELNQQNGIIVLLTEPYVMQYPEK